ncbi:DUF2612 domain-containing protein [Pandoraea terrigena]|uniref:Bacteriophage protein n=1 Tax=Pandoraea terrigena TaxID=2508292 RepID=A0A5E4V6H6_9BURK|nr:DUF2612 domain-containing protein [Pandoraea terrigena]VVE07691.1 bacteriophage protein [Pandoraea terrigena]
MKDVQSTILSQYSNAPTLNQLIQSMNGYIDPAADLDKFYSMMWDVSTAVGKGLDNWGKIVGLENGRLLKIPDGEIYFGFDEAGTASAQPFDQGTFFNGTVQTQNFYLSDDAFRTLIMVKAIVNITDCSIPSINALLQSLFKGRGRCYVIDGRNMTMRFTFEFYLQPFEVAILTQSGILPRPTGVDFSYIQVPIPNVFGFAEAGIESAAPFDQGTFYEA